MRWLKQQKGSKNCGQIALAVITGKSVKSIEKLMGHNQATVTKDLVKVLRKLGYKCPNRLKCLKEKPVLAIAKLTHKLRYGWHWIVIYNDEIFDGVLQGDKKWKQGHKITSYLPIEKRK